MTFSEAYQKWSEVWGHKQKVKSCCSAFRKTLLEPFGGEEMKVFTDAFIINVIFANCKVSKKQKDLVVALLQHILHWVGYHQIDPDYAPTAFETEGLEVRVPSEFVTSDEEAALVPLLDQTPKTIIRQKHDYDRFCWDLMKREGFAPDAIAKGTCYMEVLHLNKVYRGIGIGNMNLGTEFYSPELKPEPITIHSFGILYLPLLDVARTPRCCVFADFMDCMAFLTLCERNYMGCSHDSDMIVLNHPRNYRAMLVDLDLYEHVSCYFPQTDYGTVLTREVMVRHSGAQDMSAIYGGHESLKAYVRYKAGYQPKRYNQE